MKWKYKETISFSFPQLSLFKRLSMPKVWQWKDRLTILAVLVVLVLAGCESDIKGSIDRAQQYKAERQYRSAIIELKSVLQDDLDNAEARLLLGTIYLEIEDGASAEKELRKAQSLQSADNVVVPLLSRALILQKNNDAVLGLELQSVLSLKPVAKLAASKALACLAIKQNENANRYINQALYAAPNASWVRFAHAQVLIAQKSYSQAITVLEKLLADDPRNGIAWSLLGNTYVTISKLTEGEHAYTQAIATRAVVSTDHFRRGSARLMLGKLEAAAEDAEILLKRHPKWVHAGHLAGKVSFQQQRYAEAEEILESTYQLDFNNFEVVFLLARTYLALNKLERAEVLAESAFQLRPGSTLTRKVLAEAYLRQEKWDKAEELLQPLVAAYPKDLMTRRALLVSLTQQEKNSEADALMQQALQTLSDEGERVALARYYLSRNEAERVITLLHNRSEKDDALLFLQADAYFQLKQYNQARKSLLLIVERSPDLAHAHYGLAQVNTALGNLREAEVSYRTARKLEREEKKLSVTQ
jgi:putative PEP-CTERM system TPR-repeat lipoprotein